MAWVIKSGDEYWDDRTGEFSKDIDYAYHMKTKVIAQRFLDKYPEITGQPQEVEIKEV